MYEISLRQNWLLMLRFLLSIFPPLLTTTNYTNSAVKCWDQTFITLWLSDHLAQPDNNTTTEMTTNFSNSGPEGLQEVPTSAPSWDSWRLWTDLTAPSSWSASSTPRRRPRGAPRRGWSSLCSPRTGGSPARPPWLSSSSLPRLEGAPDQRWNVGTSTPQQVAPTLLARWWHFSRVCKTFEWPTRLEFLFIYLFILNSRRLKW